MLFRSSKIHHHLHLLYFQGVCIYLLKTVEDFKVSDFFGVFKIWNASPGTWKPLCSGSYTGTFSFQYWKQSIIGPGTLLYNSNCAKTHFESAFVKVQAISMEAFIRLRKFWILAWGTLIKFWCFPYDECAFKRRNLFSIDEQNNINLRFRTLTAKICRWQLSQVAFFQLPLYVY